MIYVSMTDEFMSGWGQAKNKINKFIVECGGPEQAQTIRKNALIRGEMSDVKIHNEKPKFGKNVYSSWSKFDELGEIWKI